MTRFCFVLIVVAVVCILMITTNATTRIGIGSCARLANSVQNELQSVIWSSIHRSLVDNDDDDARATWIWLGDITYADHQPYGKWLPFVWAPSSVERVQQLYDEQKSQPGYARLVRDSRIEVLGVTDDHDVNANNGDSTYRKVMDDVKPILMRFLDEDPVTSERAQHDGVYTHHLIDNDRVNVILLDTRTFRTPLPSVWRRMLPFLFDDDGNDDMLGDEQWQWLRDTLTLSKARVHLIGSGTQILPTDKPIEESWIHHGRSRRRLLALLDELGTPGVIFVSGDIHSAELLRSDCALSYPLYELTSSGMTHSVRSMLKHQRWLTDLAYRVVRSRLTLADYDHLNYGIVDIDWEAQPSPLIDLRIHSELGDLVFARNVSLDELQPAAAATATHQNDCTDLILHRQRLYLAWLTPMSMLITVAIALYCCCAPSRMSAFRLNSIVNAKRGRVQTKKD